MALTPVTPPALGGRGADLTCVWQALPPGQRAVTLASGQNEASRPQLTPACLLHNLPTGAFLQWSRACGHPQTWALL